MSALLAWLMLAGQAAVVQAGSPEAPLPVLVGTVVHVTDGDTIRVRLGSGPITVRLDSIDAPERDQPWGAQATSALAARIEGLQVSLQPVTQDRYDRLVAVVFLGDDDVNAWMVRQGDAWAYRRYLKNADYCAWEDEARTAKRGLWSAPASSWRAPWQWRAAQRGERKGYTDFSHESTRRCIAAIPR